MNAIGLRRWAATLMVVATLGATSAQASLKIDATDLSGWSLGVNYWTFAAVPPASNPTLAEIKAAIGYTDPLFTLYKSDFEEGTVDGDDSGPFSDSYDTLFTGLKNISETKDPTGATIEYNVGEPKMLNSPLFLHIKDGNHEPYNYVFDISAWDRECTLELLGFWADKGAISHIEILGGEGVIPEPTMLLVWSGLAGMALQVRRRRV